MSAAEDEEAEIARVVAVASGATAGGVTTLALGCGGATRLPQKLAMESCRSLRLAAALWLAQHMWDFNELMPIDTILIFFLHNVQYASLTFPSTGCSRCKFALPHSVHAFTNLKHFGVL